MSPPPSVEPPPVDFGTFLKAATDAAEAKGRSDSRADEIVTAMSRLAAPAAPPKSPWVDWLRSSILPVVIFAIGAFVTYQKDQASVAEKLAQMSKSLDTVSQRLEFDERATADRVKDLVPMIRGTDMAQKQSEMMDKAQNDRIEAVAQSIMQLRGTVETLRDAVNKTHQDLMIDRARRGEKESRVVPPRGSVGGVDVPN